MSTTDTITCHHGLGPAHPWETSGYCPPEPVEPAPDTERDERLRGIHERVEAATEGPWRWTNTTEPYLMAPRTRVVMAFSRMGMQGAQPQFRGDDGFLEDAGRANLYDFPDARLIAAAPEDMRYLLAEVARLDAVVTAVRDLHRAQWDHCQGCYDSTGRLVAYPCPTVRALDGGAS